MAKYDVKMSCGHTETIQLFGKMTDRDRRIAWLGEHGICSACYKARKDAAHAAETAAAKAKADEENLPELTGSEKQINWALAIRAKKFEALDNRLAEMNSKIADEQQQRKNQIALKATRNVLARRTDSRFWIDNRSGDALRLIANNHLQTELKDEFARLTDAENNNTNDAIIAAIDDYKTTAEAQDAAVEAEIEAAAKNEEDNTMTTIETKIASNGSTYYYVRENGKLRRISSKEATRLTIDNILDDRDATQAITDAEIEAAKNEEEPTMTKAAKIAEIENAIANIIAERNEAYDELAAAEDNEEIAQWFIDQLRENIEELGNQYWELVAELDAAKAEPDDDNDDDPDNGAPTDNKPPTPPEFTTKTADNGKITFFLGGKRAKEADIVNTLIETQGTYYSASVHGYDVDNFVSADFASPITAYKWVRRMRRKSRCYGDGDANISRVNGTIYDSETIWTQKMPHDKIADELLKNFVEQEDASYHIEECYREVEAYVSSYVAEGLTTEQAEKIYIAACVENLGRKAVEALVNSFKANDAPESDASEDASTSEKSAVDKLFDLKEMIKVRTGKGNRQMWFGYGKLISKAEAEEYLHQYGLTIDEYLAALPAYEAECDRRIDEAFAEHDRKLAANNTPEADASEDDDAPPAEEQAAHIANQFQKMREFAYKLISVEYLTNSQVNSILVAIYADNADAEQVKRLVEKFNADNDRYIDACAKTIKNILDDEAKRAELDNTNVFDLLPTTDELNDVDDDEPTSAPPTDEPPTIDDDDLTPELIVETKITARDSVILKVDGKRASRATAEDKIYSNGDFTLINEFGKVFNGDIVQNKYSRHDGYMRIKRPEGNTLFFATVGEMVNHLAFDNIFHDEPTDDEPEQQTVDEHKPTVEIKTAKNGTKIFYADRQRVSRDTALKIAEQNRGENLFYLEWEHEVNAYYVGGGIENSFHPARKELRTLDIRIDEYHGYTVKVNGSSLHTFSYKANAVWLVNAIIKAYVGGERGIKVERSGQVVIVDAAQTKTA